MEPDDDITLDLFSRAQAGDEAARNAFLCRIHRRVADEARRQRNRWRTSPVQTMDVAHDILITFAKQAGPGGLARFSSVDSLERYISRAIKQRLQRGHREASRPTRDRLSTDAERGAHGTAPEPPDTAIERQTAERLGEVIQGLAHDERAVVTMMMELRNLSEVARRLGMERHVAKERYRRACESLSRHLGADDARP